MGFFFGLVASDVAAEFAVFVDVDAYVHDNGVFAYHIACNHAGAANGCNDDVGFAGARSQVKGA